MNFNDIIKKIKEALENLFKPKKTKKKIKITITKKTKPKTEKIPEVKKDADYWNNKWPQATIRYGTRPGKYEDIRNVFEISENEKKELQKIADKFLGSDDDKAIKILKFVRDNISYVSEMKLHNTPEYWQLAGETWESKKGDCEDGAILIMVLMKLAGIPAYKRKLCAGYVEDPSKDNEKIGHAYCIYLAKDDEWYCLDWCYWYSESVSSFLNVKHSEREHYKEIWWTTNEELSWRQHDTILKEELSD